MKNRVDKRKMTKEELEQQADACMHNALFWLKLPISKENVKKGSSYILKLLEPREKRIAELEKENEQIKNSDTLCKLIGEQKLKITDLENKLANADYQLEGRDLEIKELEAQIEKMKNWCNCKNYSQCLIELAEQGKGMKPSECCVNCKKWELGDYGTRLERRNKKKQEIKEK